MTEKQRFDPVGWFATACFLILGGVLALALAVHLLRSIWPVLLLAIGGAALVAATIVGLICWHRRQPW